MKLDLNSFINKEFINKYGEKFIVLNYLSKKKIITAMILSSLKLITGRWSS